MLNIKLKRFRLKNTTAICLTDMNKIHVLIYNKTTAIRNVSWEKRK